MFIELESHEITRRRTKKFFAHQRRRCLGLTVDIPSHNNCGPIRNSEIQQAGFFNVAILSKPVEVGNGFKHRLLECLMGEVRVGGFLKGSGRGIGASILREQFGEEKGEGPFGVC